MKPITSRVAKILAHLDTEGRWSLRSVARQVGCSHEYVRQVILHFRPEAARRRESPPRLTGFPDAL